MTDAATPQVLQLRVVVEAADYDAAVAFYRDTLGLPEYLAFAWSTAGGVSPRSL